MPRTAFLAFFFFSVLLASNAHVPFSDAQEDVDPTTTVKGFSFAARATPNVAKGSSDGNHALSNEANMLYTSKVNVGGHDFTLIVDTGSSDLWVTSTPKLKLDRTTSTTVNLTYALGAAYGTLVYGPVCLGGYCVPTQAFLSVSKTYDQHTEGILGLGLNALSALERAAHDASARSLMASVFAQRPDTPRLLGIALERTEDGAQTRGGSLHLGEYDPRYADVGRMPRIGVTPTAGSRWTIPMDAMTVDGRRHALRSGVEGAKKGRAIALVDSGTSLAYVPPDAVDAIYGTIDGAVHVQHAGQDAWFVPCFAQVNLSFTFGNVTYPINPLELTTPLRVVLNGSDAQHTVCVNAFRTPLDGTARELDFLLGDVFMRNVYSVFNFGDAREGDDARGASVQLLSRTNRDQVFVDFVERRKFALRLYPPLFNLGKLHADGSTEGGGRLMAPGE